MARLIFIINPKSGIRKRIDIPAGIITAMGNSHSYEIAFTERKGHATELAFKAAAEKYDAVIGIGGDGTINECAKALLHTEIPLGIIPMGSGNGLARHLKLPLTLHDGLHTIKKLLYRNIDTGTFNDHLFLSNAGTGLVAAVASDFDNNNVRRGFTGYSLHTFKTFFAYKPVHYHITIDGKELNGNYLAVNVCNSNQFGYEAKICPAADIDDGLLDLVLIKKTNIPNNIKLLYQLFYGNVLHDNFVEHVRGKNITIHSEQEAHSQVDGEPLGLVNSSIAIVEPLSLKIITPKSGKP